MRDSNALFILIRSMSKEEKRYFRLYAQRYNRKSNYLRLFDAMERQTVYDEEKLRRQFQGEAFIRRLSVTAEYLYGLILRSLAEQHEDDTPEQQAIALYRRIGVLIHRRMYDQAERFIRRAKELCVHYDLFEELHLVMSLEAYLPGRDRAVLFAELERAMAVYNNNYACGVFAERMRALNEERRVVRTARDRAEIDAALRLCPIASAEEALSFSAQLRYYFGYAQYYSVVGRQEQADQCHQRIVGLFHEHPQFIETNTLAYISEVRMVFTTYVHSGTTEQVHAVMEQYRSIRVPARFVPFYDILLFYMELNYCKWREQLDDVPALRKRYPVLRALYAQELQAYGVDMEVHIIMYFAVLYFMRREYGKALRELNSLFRTTSLRRYPAVENDAKILFLILHFELGHRNLLPYIIRSTYRFLLGRERLYAFERCVLHHLRRLPTVHDNRRLQTWFRALYNDVKALADDPVEGNFLRRGDYLRWLKSRVEAAGTTAAGRHSGRGASSAL